MSTEGEQDLADRTAARVRHDRDGDRVTALRRVRGSSRDDVQSGHRGGSDGVCRGGGRGQDRRRTETHEGQLHAARRSREHYLDTSAFVLAHPGPAIPRTPDISAEHDQQIKSTSAPDYVSIAANRTRSVKEVGIKRGIPRERRRPRRSGPRPARRRGRSGPGRDAGRPGPDHRRTPRAARSRARLRR